MCKTVDTLASIVVSDRGPLWAGHTRAGNALAVLLMGMAAAGQTNPAMWSGRLRQIKERLCCGPLLPALVAGYRRADGACVESSVSLLNCLVCTPANVTLLLKPAAEGGFGLAPDLAAALREPMQKENELRVYHSCCLMYNMLGATMTLFDLGPWYESAMAQLTQPAWRMISGLLRVVCSTFLSVESGHKFARPDFAAERVRLALYLLEQLLVHAPSRRRRRRAPTEGVFRGLDGCRRKTSCRGRSLRRSCACWPTSPLETRAGLHGCSSR